MQCTVDEAIAQALLCNLMRVSEWTGYVKEDVGGQCLCDEASASCSKRGLGVSHVYRHGRG